mmetsp:Transcript_23196/g.55946  ORF Transcript_23196/g.55946 Transcript_23196/m.55946 type:complete len:96 (-) Transcript_23196:299-586(-)
MHDPPVAKAMDKILLLQLDTLLRVFASRANHVVGLPVIYFEQFCDLAEAINGEKPFGERVSERRKKSRRTYDMYLLRARIGMVLELTSTGVHMKF